VRVKPLGPEPAARRLVALLPFRLIIVAVFGYALVSAAMTGMPLGVLFSCFVIVVVLTPVLLEAGFVRREHRAQVETGALTEQSVTYPIAALGHTLARSEPPKGYRVTERSTTIGTGAATFERASAATLRWEIKMRAGFRVIRVGEQGAFFSDAPVPKGECAIVKFGPIRETVRVIRVVDEPRRRGFAYGTLPEHPLRGEEAFLVEWRDDDTVELAVRSFSRPSTIYGWIAYPLLLVAQSIFVRRYLRVLLE
jgi:uncharacterized protein (UPF0548 family)